MVDALCQEVLSQRALHADETQLQALQPGNPKPQRSYLWAYAPSQPPSRKNLTHAAGQAYCRCAAHMELAHRDKVSGNCSISSALDYSLKRWTALTHYLDDGQLSIDNNWIENQMHPISLGRKSWLFVGSLRTGQRAAAIMGLIQSAKLNGLGPHAYLTDLLTALPTHSNSRIAEQLPLRWIVQ